MAERVRAWANYVAYSGPPWKQGGWAPSREVSFPPTKAQRSSAAQTKGVHGIPQEEDKAKIFLLNSQSFRSPNPRLF